MSLPHPAAPLSPPSRRLIAMELRAIPEYLGTALSWPVLNALAPRGDGHPVMVLPGLSVGDGSTALLRRFLGRRGYAVEGWGMGRNLGPRPGVEDELIARVEAMAERHGRAVSLVGWSLGGLYARQISRLLPARVRSVVTLASPFNGDPRATNAWRLYEKHSGLKVGPGMSYRGGPLEAPLPVPSTAIFSRTDGICAWAICTENHAERAESIEVRASHCGMGHNRTAMFAVADRLAQPEGSWQPFRRSGMRRLFYPGA